MKGRREVQPSPRIGAIHALLNAIPTTQEAFDRVWPEADVAHLLDGSLYLDRNAGTADDAELERRVRALVKHSADTGQQAVVVTGSFFGGMAEASRADVDIPVATSFDGIIERALSLDQPLHVLSTAPDSATLLAEAIEGQARARGRSISLSSHPVGGAMDALLGGSPEEHDRLILEAIAALDPDTAVAFAQFSMERILPASDDAHSAPVIGPASEGVAWLRQLVGGR